MTPQQLVTLRAFIAANPTWAAMPMSNTSGSIIAAELNANSNPAFIVERTSVTRHEILTHPSFDWASAGGYIARSAGERDAFRDMFNSTGTVNPSLSGIKAAFTNIFSGGGAGAVANRALIVALSKRTATVAEKLFAAGPGTGADNSPATLVFEGVVTGDEVVQARELA